MSFRSRVLWRLAAIFQGLSQLCLIFALPCAFFASRARFWWPLAALCAVIVIPFLPFYVGFQVIGAMFGFLLLQELKTRATMDDNGIECVTPDGKIFLNWVQISAISRTYGRPFPQMQTRFRDSIGFGFTLKDGEIVWVDELDETQLRLFAAQYEITLDNFAVIPVLENLCPPIANPE